MRDLAAEHDPELDPLLEGTGLVLAAWRPIDGAQGKRLGVSLRLLLAPRDLGRVLASPSLQDRLTTLAASAVGENPEDMLLDLDFGCARGALSTTHAYRGGHGSVPDLSSALSADGVDLEAAAREVLAGYFEGQANAPQIDVGAAADELVVTVHIEHVLFSQLAPTLRDVLRRLTPKALIERVAV
jgi:hypothetical protein